MDALLAAEVQSFVAPKRLNSAHSAPFPDVARPPAAGPRSEPALARASVTGAWELGDTVDLIVIPGAREGQYFALKRGSGTSYSAPNPG